MTNYERVKNMDVEDLARLLVIEGEQTDEDEDFDGESYFYTSQCYYTPIGILPGWFSEDDAAEEVIEWLNSECELEKSNG